MNSIQLRLNQLRESFSHQQIEGLLVTNPQNIRWLSGFRGSYGRLLITNDKAILATDTRYSIQARAEAPDFTLFNDKRSDDSTIALLAEGEIKKIGFEADTISWTDGQKLMAMTGYQWLPTIDMVEKLRVLKDEQELTLIKAAAAITDEIMLQIPDLLKPGISEADLAWTLERMLRDRGSTGLAFPTIVAFGSNSALPHHQPGPRKLKENEIVLVDMGAEIDGYKSDLTRTFFFGGQDEKFNQLYHLVLDAQTAALNGIHAGALSGQLHHLAMDTIDQGGYGKNFAHGLGHGLGLDIHEMPMLSFLRDDLPLQSAMVITIEPGIYIKEWGGIRLEDLVMVTNEGFQLLSHCPK